MPIGSDDEDLGLSVPQSTSASHSVATVTFFAETTSALVPVPNPGLSDRNQPAVLPEAPRPPPRPTIQVAIKNTGSKSAGTKLPLKKVKKQAKNEIDDIFGF